jgi:DNA repair ATPase RecN
MAGRTALPTLILDEIDSGISGEIAIQMGNRMKEMSARHQVIAISHLPQIAAKADSHLFVYKETKGARTVTAIKNLTPQERITEIAKNDWWCFTIGSRNRKCTGINRLIIPIRVLLPAQKDLTGL